MIKNLLYATFLLFTCCIVNVVVAQTQFCDATPTSSQLQWMDTNTPYSEDSGHYQIPASQPIIQIPIVFHVYSKNQAFVVSDSEIDAQMAILNNRFQDMNIQFYELLSRNYYSQEQTGTKHTVRRPDDAPFFHYEYIPNVINIYIVDKYISEGVSRAGFSSFPQGVEGSDGLDRIFISSWGFQNGASFSHEMGHFFGLLHTFHGMSDCTVSSCNVSCGQEISENNYVSGDRCVDTKLVPNLEVSILDANCELACSGFDFPFDQISVMDGQNIMSYNLPLCRNMFTPDQNNRGNFYAIHYRDYLINNTQSNILSVLSPQYMTGNSLQPISYTFYSASGATELVELFYRFTDQQEWVYIGEQIAVSGLNSYSGNLAVNFESTPREVEFMVRYKNDPNVFAIGNTYTINPYSSTVDYSTTLDFDINADTIINGGTYEFSWNPSAVPSSTSKGKIYMYYDGGVTYQEILDVTNTGVKRWEASNLKESKNVVFAIHFENANRVGVVPRYIQSYNISKPTITIISQNGCDVQESCDISIRFAAEQGRLYNVISNPASDSYLGVDGQSQYTFHAVSTFSPFTIMVSLATQPSIRDTLTLFREDQSVSSQVGSCFNLIYSTYYYQCGENDLSATVAEEIRFSGRECGSNSPGSISGGGGSSGPGSSGPGSSGPGFSGTIGSTVNTSVDIPVITENDDCKECLNDLLFNGTRCLVTTLAPQSSLLALFDIADWIRDPYLILPVPPEVQELMSIIDKSQETANCLTDFSLCNCGGLVIDKAPVACVLGLVCDAEACGILPPHPLLNGGNRAIPNPDLPTVLVPYMQDLLVFTSSLESKQAIYFQYYDTLMFNENISEIAILLSPFFTNRQRIEEADSIAILDDLSDFDIHPLSISNLISRWNRTLHAWDNNIFSPTAQYPNIIDSLVMSEKEEMLTEADSYVQNRGFIGLDNMVTNAIEFIQEYSLDDDPEENPICASVGIQLSQTLTMTREAFEGTLTIFNGSVDGRMDSIQLELLILNENGVVSNDLFEIETINTIDLTSIDGTGILEADTKGTAKILFTPESGAAPTVPVPYRFTGNLSYIDPFSGDKVTMPLSPITLTVNPSPDLFLHYFMERDVLGDDPLTAEIEPSIPAKLGLMIENLGYGEAMDVNIETARPQVIDNDKGLALAMNYIGSRLQGQDVRFGLSNIEFGDIPPLSTKVGEWLFQSDLLGHFTGYATNIRHSDSRGNPDLSLVNGVELHELIRSITVYGNLDDGIEDFLVNEVPDANDHPDVIYLTQGGTVYDVAESTNGEFIGDIVYPDFTNTLSIIPQDSNWNYIELPDPGNGQFDIVRVIRQADGQVIPHTNAWLTFVTIPDSKVPIYENKFHLVDDVLSESSQRYTVIWAPKDPFPLEVDTISLVPVSAVVSPVTEFIITYSKEILDSTLSWEDFTLTRSGQAVNLDPRFIITPIDSLSYHLDLSAFTTQSGFYELTAHTATISDQFGMSGRLGKQVAWTQSLAQPTIVSYHPFQNGSILQSADSLDFWFNVAIDTSTFTLDDIEVFYENSLVSDSAVDLCFIGSNFTHFRLKGLTNVIGQNGLYRITFDMPQIQSTTNERGLALESIEFTIDDKRPELMLLETNTDGGLDEQHVTSLNVVVSEKIQPLDSVAIHFQYNGNQLNSVHYKIQQVSDSVFQISWHAPLSYPEGAYEITIDETLIYDLSGNSGIDSSIINWNVDRSPSLMISNMEIKPDYGLFNDDEWTYNDTFQLYFTLNEAAHNIVINQLDNGTLSYLNHIDHLSDGTHSIFVNLNFGGNTAIQISAEDSFSNEVQAILPMHIDEVPLSGIWQERSHQTFENHPDSIHFQFVTAVLEKEISNEAILVWKNNISIPHEISIQRIDDDRYRFSNLESLPDTYGDYRIGLDMKQFFKEGSGKSGEEIIYYHYKLKDLNRSPVANAGPDQVINDLDTVYLDASLSIDLDDDPLTYKWTTFDSILISNDSVTSPYIILDPSHVGQTLTFMVVVSDSSTSATDICRVFVDLDDVLVDAKVFLQGPYQSQSDLMVDSLRSRGYLPIQTPYTDLGKYPFGFSSDQIDNSALGNKGHNSIVDWVYLELIDITTGVAIQGGSFLLQRDGDIVGLDGKSSLIFADVPNGTYRLKIDHRNHLPILSSHFIEIQRNHFKVVDFTSDINNVEGGVNAVRSIQGVYTMIAGDTDENGQIQQSDLFRSRQSLGTSGYSFEDIDMDGNVSSPDLRDYIQLNLGKGKQF